MHSKLVHKDAFITSEHVKFSLVIFKIFNGLQHSKRSRRTFTVRIPDVIDRGTAAVTYIIAPIIQEELRRNALNVNYYFGLVNSCLSP